MANKPALCCPPPTVRSPLHPHEIPSTSTGIPTTPGYACTNPLFIKDCGDADDDRIEISPLVGCLNGVEIQGVVMMTAASPPVVLGEMWRSPAGVWGALPAGATVGKCADVALPVADTEKYYSYVPHQVDEATAGTTYIRKQGAATSDTWLVQRVVESGTATTITYAGVRNNPAVTTPTAAWTARASLVYGDLSEA